MRSDRPIKGDRTGAAATVELSPEAEDFDGQAAGEDVGGESGEGSGEDAGEGDVRSRWWVRAPLVLALALALAGGTLATYTARLRADPAAADRALVDADETARVISDVDNALSTVLSYSHDDPAATERAADVLLSGAAARQYRLLFAQVRKQAPRQRLTVTTRVTRAGVTRLSGDTAHLLVFLDQLVSRGGKRSGDATAAQLSITARLDNGRWRITDIQVG